MKLKLVYCILGYVGSYGMHSLQMYCNSFSETDSLSSSNNVKYMYTHRARYIDAAHGYNYGAMLF